MSDENQAATETAEKNCSVLSDLRPD